MPAPHWAQYQSTLQNSTKSQCAAAYLIFPLRARLLGRVKKAGPGQMPKGPLEGVENHLYLSMTAFIPSQAASMSDTSLNCVRQRSRFWPSRWVRK